MALAAAAQKIESGDGIPWRTCAVCHALSTIPPEEADGFRALMANKSLRYTEIESIIAADPDTPLVVPWATISRHARGQCEAREKLR